MEKLTPLLVQRGEIRAETEPSKNGHSQHAGESELSQVVIRQAHCCCPLPGDPIVGLLHPNKGIVVHRSDCRALRRSRAPQSERNGAGASPAPTIHESERVLEMSWLAIEMQRYRAPILLIAHDRAGLLRDVAGVVADAGINMTSVASTTNASLQKAVITATLEIEEVDQIAALFERLQQIPNVVSVRRDLGRGIHA